jgi:hypothetical protein
MRILIGNHIDDSLLRQVDMRMFAQRVLWLARGGDLIILCAPPDEAFVEHVASHVGADARTLRFLVCPSGRFEGKLFDPLALTEPAFVETARQLAPDLSEIVALWPSPQVARFASALGARCAFAGADFFSQAGDALANSKANFRAFASALRLPIPDGGVCRTPGEATALIESLLERGQAAVIKQAQNSAGAGNQLVCISKDSAYGTAGMKYRFDLEGDVGRVAEFVQQRWEWASCGGSYPVTVEAFIPNARTVYAEFMASDEGVRHLACGWLSYENGALVREAAPLRWLPQHMLARLVSEGQRLAEIYRAIGYRGYLSTDAIADGDGGLWFTEMNARIGGSPHIYQGIGERVARVWDAPYRTVTQFVFSPAWGVPGTAAFLGALAATGLAYDQASRTGVLLATPPVGSDPTPPFFFCVVHADDDDPQTFYRTLDKHFCAGRPKSTS